MYLSKTERKEIMAVYGFDNVSEESHYQIEPDTWIYLFDSDDRKYVLISADYLGVFEFEVFPHLLKFTNSEFAELEFVLQREIFTEGKFPEGTTSNTVLFEYTD